ncbi:MAG: type I-C CRISPR-associated protein Cas8c/Csd1 [Xanthomonadales bacterium]|nr:hypothetical protein [Xanthomonadales bacterium]MCC6593494.1 type I-C CRISPR-associated protein Cas8c/Csd1 [Xanthomonadales bacterium]MCE7930118.1 type I-C CRISPR-associated protein Cas8c/Csd1 [Xanthomonadales bacterium PRO6]
MILQALVEYYDRRCADPDPARHLPVPGFEYKAIPFIIELDLEGGVLQLRDTRSIDQGRTVARSFLVPQGEKKTSGVKANLLWDSAEYVIGLDRGRNSPATASPACAFALRVEELSRLAPDDDGIQAVLKALARADWTVVQSHPSWPDIVETNPVMTFALADSGSGELVCQRKSVIAAIKLIGRPQAARGRCLVEGLETEIERLHPAIKGVRDAQTSGANVVSFNARAFESYGKTERQGENAPVGTRAVFAYSTALNALLSRDSPNRVQVGDATTVIWADRRTDLDAALASIFGDDPDAGVQAVTARFAALQSGRVDAAGDDVRFFILGLAPNAARIAIRFWQQATLREIAPRILQHFRDLAIQKQFDGDPNTPSMFRLLTSIAAQGKADNIPPRIAGEWTRAILEGTAYPASLLQSAVSRCRAEQGTREAVGNVPYLRAAILKACLNREHRRRHPEDTHRDLIQETLDMSQSHPAYLLGRLFAVLERIQARAQPGINATIRDRYYGAASTTPAAVFPTLLRLKNAHLKKLADGESAWFEKQIGGICGSLDRPLLSDFPRQLDLPSQGMFALGYYQQRQSFFARADETEPKTEN